MLNYVRSRWAFLRECGTYSEKHLLVKLVVFLGAVYNFLALIQPAVQFPNVEFSLPKLPIPWALRLVLAAIFWLLIEGAYRRSQEIESEKGQIELDKNTLQHDWNNLAGELGVLQIALESAGKEVDRLRQALAAQETEIERLTWPEDRPKLSFRTWGQWIPKSVIAGSVDSSRSMQCGFYLSNDGGAALDVTVERFVIGDLFAARGSTFDRIESGTEGFAPVWLENVPPLRKWALSLALEKLWQAQIESRELTFGQPLVIPVSVVYKDFNDLWYRTRSVLIYIHRTAEPEGRIDFKFLKQERLGNTPPSLVP